MNLVNLHWDTLSIVPDLDLVPFSVDLNLDHVLSAIVLIVVCCIHEYLIYTNLELGNGSPHGWLSLTKDLVESRHVLDRLVYDTLLLCVVDPQVLLVHLYTPNVSVWPKQDVFELSLLLVDVLDVIRVLRLLGAPFLATG